MNTGRPTLCPSGSKYQRTLGALVGARFSSEDRTFVLLAALRQRQGYCEGVRSQL